MCTGPKPYPPHQPPHRDRQRETENRDKQRDRDRQRQRAAPYWCRCSMPGDSIEFNRSVIFHIIFHIEITYGHLVVRHPESEASAVWRAYREKRRGRRRVQGLGGCVGSYVLLPCARRMRPGGRCLSLCAGAQELMAVARTAASTGSESSRARAGFTANRDKSALAKFGQFVYSSHLSNPKWSHAPF